MKTFCTYNKQNIDINKQFTIEMDYEQIALLE